MRKLEYTELKYFCDPSIVNMARKYGEISQVMIGQERAEKALNLGLGIKKNGYNIYISGESGTGKMTFAKVFAQKYAKNEPTPPDLCYIYNFTDPKYPNLLKLPPGEGKVFKEEMEDLVEVLCVEIPKAFSDKKYELDKNEIVKSYTEKRDEIIKEISEEAKEKNFEVKSTNSGIYFVPEVDGEAISEEQFEELPQEQREQIMAISEDIQIKAVEVMRIMKDYEKGTKEKIKNLEYNIALFTVGRHISKLQEQYCENDDITNYLKDVKEDILDNIEDFLEDEETEDESALASLIPWYTKKNEEDLLSKYQVNLITDNSNTEGAPVIIEHNPVYTNIVGEVEYDSEFGNLTTDFMKIKQGALHKANGGYLILQARDILSNSYTWDTIRRALKTGKIVIEPLKEFSSGITVATIKPEALELNVKIIMVGTDFYYDLLYDYDEEFQKLFKINVPFDYEMNLTEKNINSMVQFVDRFCETEKIPTLDDDAVCKIIEYSARLAERQKKLTSRFGTLCTIIIEASECATLDKSNTISKAHVDQAIWERDYRANLYEEKLAEMIEEDVIMIDTSGMKVGQINGLAVLESGEHVFAKPSRITATTYIGKSGIINIEKEAEMSGSIHDKGIQVLIGYLGQTYAQENPLSLSCRVCFEQNYNGIDGDSASSTELYAILSSLTELPINQEIAVTGSMNQRGEIQPVGGVTYKIEGFFDLCKNRGLTGSQGVIIPVQNVADLILKDDVIEAVKNNMFHIHAVGHVDEGIEILTGTKTADVHAKATEKLKNFHLKSMIKA